MKFLLMKMKYKFRLINSAPRILIRVKTQGTKNVLPLTDKIQRKIKGGSYILIIINRH